MTVEPFYFGSGERPLFGLHSAPDGDRQRDGVLLCHPVGHEYTLAHRAYRQITRRLTAVGFHVLRFDYYGTGDSAGDCEQGTVARWKCDIADAIGELRARTGCSRVQLVGCRLGAALAVMVGAERGDIDRMLLWDPVVQGRDHLLQLTSHHREMLRRSQVHAVVKSTATHEAEFLGFALGKDARAEIGSLDLLHIARSPARDILLLASAPDRATTALEERLAALGARVATRFVAAPLRWEWIEDPSTVLVPQALVGDIVSWASESSS